MKVRLLTAFLLVAGLGLCDTITFRDGRSVDGSYLGGDARSIRVAIGDRVETYSVGDVSNISFGGSSGSTAGSSQSRQGNTRREDAVMRPSAPSSPAPAPPPVSAGRRGGTELPSGTILTVRMVDSVDSERDRVGQTFKASLDEPIMDANGNTLVTRGSDVVVKLVDDQQAGKIEGKTILTLDLVSLDVNGRTVEIDTQSITQESASRTASSTKTIGGGAVLGAIIGAIAGGGKGAAIGTVAGAGAGTAVQMSTKGQRVKIPSETRLTFSLQQPVRI